MQQLLCSAILRYGHHAFAAGLFVPWRGLEPSKRDADRHKIPAGQTLTNKPRGSYNERKWGAILFQSLKMRSVLFMVENMPFFTMNAER
jgi:hypothetical protein